MSKINLQEPQRNRNATANFVNLIRTSTVAVNFMTVNEQAESNPDCSFHSSIAFLLPGDHNAIIYLYILQQALSACVAAVISRPVLLRP